MVTNRLFSPEERVNLYIYWLGFPETEELSFSFHHSRIFTCPIIPLLYIISVFMSVMTQMPPRLCCGFSFFCGLENDPKTDVCDVLLLGILSTSSS